MARTIDVSGCGRGQRAYLEFLDQGNGYAAFDQVVFSDDGPPPLAPNRLLVALVRGDQSATQLEKSFLTLAESIVDQWEKGKLDERADAWERIQILNALLAATKATEPSQKNEALWRKLEQEYAQLELPGPARAHGLVMTDGSAVDEQVFIRGNSKNLGEVVPRPVLGGIRRQADCKSRERSTRIGPANGRSQADAASAEGSWSIACGSITSARIGANAGRFRSSGPATDASHASGRPRSEIHQRRLVDQEAAPRDAAYEGSIKCPRKPRPLLPMTWPIRKIAGCTKCRSAELEAEEIRDAMRMAISGPARPHAVRPERADLSDALHGGARPARALGGPLDGNGRRSIYLAVRRSFLNPMFLSLRLSAAVHVHGQTEMSPTCQAQALSDAE